MRRKAKNGVPVFNWRRGLGLGCALSVIAGMGISSLAQDGGTKTDAQKRAEDAAMIEQLQLFGEVFARVRAENVVDATDEDLIAAALNGALHALDPHSAYVPPVAFEESRVAAKREYGGLGI